jgi:hypothetical protein
MVQVSEQEIRRMNVEPVGIPLLDLDSTKVRHLVAVARDYRDARRNAEPARLLA